MKSALAKVSFIYFRLRNYSLIKDIIKSVFLYKFCLPHSQSLELGNGTRHKVCESIFPIFPVNFSIIRFTQYLISELNWKPKRPKTYFMFSLYLVCLYTHYRGTFFSWNKSNLQYQKEKNAGKGLPVIKNLPSRNVGWIGFTLVMLPIVWCWHLLFMDDFLEAAEKSLNCKLEKKHVPVSKSTAG